MTGFTWFKVRLRAQNEMSVFHFTKAHHYFFLQLTVMLTAADKFLDHELFNYFQLIVKLKIIP